MLTRGTCKIHRYLSPRQDTDHPKDGKLYLVRVNENIHIELYCVGKHCFKKRYEEDQIVHNLIPDGGQKPSIWGFKRVSTQLF